jgi:hypothetical protein
MSETQQILILTYVMTGIAVVQFVHSAAFRSLAKTLLSFIELVILRMRTIKSRLP